MELKKEKFCYTFEAALASYFLNHARCLKWKINNDMLLLMMMMLFF